MYVYKNKGRPANTRRSWSWIVVLYASTYDCGTCAGAWTAWSSAISVLRQSIARSIPERVGPDKARRLLATFTQTGNIQIIYEIN